jgi:hypothetical protein
VQLLAIGNKLAAVTLDCELCNRAAVLLENCCTCMHTNHDQCVPPSVQLTRVVEQRDAAMIFCL